MWAGRLIVDELELSDIKNVEKYCEYLKNLYPRIHILINNAAQTITRPTGWLNRMDTVNKTAYQMLTCGEDSLHSEWNVLLRQGKNVSNCFIKNSNLNDKIDLISSHHNENESVDDNNDKDIMINSNDNDNINNDNINVNIICNSDDNNNNDSNNFNHINGCYNSNNINNNNNSISHIISENVTSTMETSTNSTIARDLGSDSRILTLDDSAQPLDKSGK